MAFGYGGSGYGRDAGGGVRIAPRVVLALIIAAFGLVSYFSKTQVNPVTGQRQRVSMSVEEERALGLQAAPEMAQKMGGIRDPRRDRDARLVEQVGQRLVAGSDARRSPYADNFHFFLLADRKTVNAFALPGGQVFLTTALFDRLASEDQLAAVLAHEIGHVVGRHSSEQMAKGQLGKTLAAAFGVGTSDRGLKGMVAAQAVNQVMQLRYGREDENESDEFGMKYMAQAGYDPHAMLELMQILKEANDGPTPPEFLSTHPLPETRIVHIKEILDRDYARSGRREIFPRPGDIREPTSTTGWGTIYDL
jgi:predicted Zn-dependent protease